MNKYQLKNIFIYTGIMLLDNNIIMSSPDYLKEKTLKFFGILGKPEFIDFPKIKFNNQKSETTNGVDFWEKYCEIWKVKDDDFPLMNIINFLLNVYPIYVETQKNLTYNTFEKYIGELDCISKVDLSYMAHPKIVEFLDEHIDFNNRFFKLQILKSME